MTTSHAPGPWIAAGANIKAIDHGVRFNIAKVAGSKLSPEGIASTATLMAAAPDLLRELKTIVARVQLIHGDKFSVIAACAAIAKATGETA